MQGHNRRATGIARKGAQLVTVSVAVGRHTRRDDEPISRKFIGGNRLFRTAKNVEMEACGEAKRQF
jgi:hypothetical protein